jgi:hypothetical protein
MMSMHLVASEEGEDGSLMTTILPLWSPTMAPVVVVGLPRSMPRCR